MVTSFTDWNPNELCHYGIKGMRWGQRRFQNPDGTLTSLGQKRYGKGGYASAEQMTKHLNKLDKEHVEATYRARQASKADRVERLQGKLRKATAQNKTEKAAKLKEKIKKTTEGLSDRRKAKAEGYYKLAENSKKMTEKILTSAKANRYTVRSKLVQRSVSSNRDKALTVLGAIGAAGTATAMLEYGPTINGRKFGFGVAPVFGGVRKGTKYKVKNNYSRRYKANEWR